MSLPRIVSLLPAATEIVGALGLMEQLVGVSHECDFPSQANERPRVTHCPIHNAGLTSGEVDEWVRRALRETGTIYSIDEPLLRELRPDLILTQKLCDVCAVGYGTVARLAAALPGPPKVVNLEPSSLSNIFENIRETRRFEIYDLRRPGQRRSEARYRSITDGANVAQFLGQDQIGPQFAQERLVDRINRARVPQRVPDPFIHFATR